VVLPLAGQCFVMESSDRPQPGRASEANNVLPFLVALENFDGNLAG
jgi:hypothetical protein